MRVLILFLPLAAAVSSAAEDAYYLAPVTRFHSAESLPSESQRWRSGREIEKVTPYAAVEGGAGEAFVSCSSTPRYGSPLCGGGYEIVVKVPSGGPVRGKLFIPKRDLSGMAAVPFQFDPAEAKAQLADTFSAVRRSYYEYLLRRNLPGGSWFRYRAGQTDATAQPSNRASDSLEDTFALFSGGRALSENLQLDRVLQPTAPAEDTVELASVPGIQVQPFDWKPLLSSAIPTFDPLSALVPEDQYALFFSSFQNLLALVDEANRQGSPLIAALEDRSEDNLSQAMYERQLLVTPTDFARLLGPMVISSVALTGSDPYYRTGTDLALLFEAKVPGAITAYFSEKHTTAKTEVPGAELVQGNVEEFTYSGVVSPDRAVSSYVAVMNSAVVVSNSLYQLRQIARTAQKRQRSLAELDEYRFFRGRYSYGDPTETGLLIVPDGAIRKWCGPQWRISDSRRTRAAAVMADLQASKLQQLVAGASEKVDSPQLGTVMVTGRGVRSERYGALAFLTPIAELALQKATPAEVSAYTRFRDSYQQNWRQYFDPIALRFSVAPASVKLDLTVMPLILGSEYRSLVEVSSGEKLHSGAADPHGEAIFHLALALNGQSPFVRRTESFTAVMAPGLSDPFSWIGGILSLYVDGDPIWSELAAAEEKEKFLEANYMRLPLALYVGVRDPLKLTMFLTALRTFSSQSAPGLTVWENLSYRDLSYVKVAATAPVGPGSQPVVPAVYYAVTPESLVVTFSESVLKRALDRRATSSRSSPSWLGDNVGVRVSPPFVQILQGISARGSVNLFQSRAWANIPILNELRRAFPKEEPHDLYHRFWHRRLTDPSGGTYVWNEEWQTMESTIYGHPGMPRSAPALPPALREIREGNFGLTFEHDGLRAAVEVRREGSE